MIFNSPSRDIFHTAAFEVFGSELQEIDPSDVMARGSLNLIKANPLKGGGAKQPV
jgi:hypothetical protein